ncbi:hypothetical protein ACSBR2_008204 [Camellia fascicularis]
MQTMITSNNNAQIATSSVHDSMTSGIMPILSTISNHQGTHGSHTASTVTGHEVQNASYYGLAEGVARGGVPNARIAMYKVCWSPGCTATDILAAFDDATADGVNIISISVGSLFPTPYHKETISIRSFHAMKSAILTSCSAGNNGPYRREISNYFPWALTVAASTIDRRFVTKVALENGQTFLATSLNNFNLDGTTFPLVYSGDAGNVTFGVGPDVARPLLTWNSKHHQNQMRNCLCSMMDQQLYGLGQWALLCLLQIMRSPTATILSTEATKDVMAPNIVSFSSRGPNPISPNILKVNNILKFYFFDDRQVDYYIISGTSMSHATGAAANVKAAHPTWSPAAIKSVLMTRATIMDPSKNDHAEFAYRSGHINPLKAVDPGLVFDATEADYVDFLCNTTLVRLVSGDSSTCPSNKPGKAWDLNYPSYALSLLDREKIKASYPRTVTNVGSPNSTYYSKVSMPPPFTVIVEPSILTFSEVGEKKSFTVKVNGAPLVQVPIVLRSIEWTDGNHTVRSPIVVFNNMPSIFAAVGDYPQRKNSHSWHGVTMYHQNGILQGN